MHGDYFFFYAEANIVCILILLILLVNDRLHNTRQEKQIRFNWTVVAHIGYFVSDICWAAVLSGNLPRTRLLVGLFNFTNLVMMHLLAFEWFLYMAASENMDFRRSARRRNLCRAPMAASVLVMVVAYVIVPEFWISKTGELNSLYYLMLILMPVLYMIAAFVISLRNARKTRSREDRKLYLLIGIYPLAVVVSGLIQTIFLDAPLFCFGCTIMLLFFYIENMQTLVSVDSLTRLNNRGQINRYMDQVVYKENVRNTAMMIDIDRFKEINDTYGHGEGDRALILMAQALRQSVEGIDAPVFIGRYGGDEFTVFVQHAEGDGLPEEIISRIRTALEEKQKQHRLPYDLMISVGYDDLKDKNDSMDACIIRADDKLYEDKKSRNITR
ncbi:MAG: GGDEF domain-containing protein [Clostridia bacterium]|nr:GGDEF domain-containing protein [Clostridia bacterium]